MSEPWWITIIKSFLIINLVMVAFAYTTWLERKLLGRMQLRYGPNRAGPFGLLQPIADLIKLVRKEAFEPSSVRSSLVYISAPIVSMFTALAAFMVIPFGSGWHIYHWHVDGEILNVPIALVLVFALGSVGIYGFIVGGWASESKYSLLGAMRTCAQLVSYEVSLALAVLGVVMMGQSLSLVDIVHKQGELIPFAAPQFIGLIVFFIAGTAETSRAPFDLPEADTELVAGYHTEYSGIKFAMFFLGEYLNTLTVSAIAVTLFFGGWRGPIFSFLPWFWPLLWFLLKLIGMLYLYIWVRATLPRFRYDRLMNFGWKVLIPAGLIWVLLTGAFVVLPDVYGRRTTFIWAAIGAGVVFLVLSIGPVFTSKPQVPAEEAR
jgi:NADH-quinone oxidoreductase subunit H